MIVTRIQQLSILELEHLHIPFNEEEEQLLASISSHVNAARCTFDNECFLFFRQFQVYLMMN